MIPHLKSVMVPTLNVAGWWDQEDFFGPFAIYHALEKHDKNNENFLVVGPWNHGGWGNNPGDKLGIIPFDQATAKYFREKVQAPWFAHYLKDAPKLDLPEALTFETGTNVWRRWDKWPPTDKTQPVKLYLSADLKVAFGNAVEGSDNYISDPAHPVPYRHRPIQATYHSGTSKWPQWHVEDQRFVTDRNDVLTFESDILTENITIAGDVVAHLFASTTGSDADWVVKLIDVFPQYSPENWDLAGYHLMVNAEVFRGRYRTSFEKPEAITPGAHEYKIGLHSQNYTFLKGHRIVVQVQSSWFPIIDRNPQTFVKNIFEAKESDFQKATHTIHRGGKAASHVTINVVKGK
jgi:putative CocE/NonD family hydrolase